MKIRSFKRGHILRHAVMSALLLASAGVMAPAKADDDDYRWRDHQRQEQHWRGHDRGRGHWDHHYWDRNRYQDGDREEYVYRPPAVYYAPRPPSGLGFVFHVGD